MKIHYTPQAEYILRANEKAVNDMLYGQEATEAAPLLQHLFSQDGEDAQGDVAGETEAEEEAGEEKQAKKKGGKKSH